MRQEGQLLGIGNGVMAGAMWGFVFLAPQLLPGFSAVQLSVARYLVYGVIAVFLLGRRWPRLGRAEWLGLVWLGLLGNAIYYVLLGQAIRLAGGAEASLIVGLIPVVVTLVGARESGAVSLRSLAVPLVLCCLGVGLIGHDALQGGAASARKLEGLLYAAGALFSWSGYAVLNSRWLTRLPDVSAQDWSLLTGVVTGALVLPLGLFAFMDGVPHDAAAWGRFWMVNAGVAIFASVVGNAFWNRASRLLSLTLLGQMIVFETLFALLYSFLWEQRWPTGWEAAAVVCLVSGVLGCASAHRKPGAPEAVR